MLGAAAMSSALVAEGAISAPVEPSPASEATSLSCDVHIWQRDINLSHAAANNAALGLVGALRQDGYDKKYPLGSVKDLMDQELNIDRLPVVLGSVEWKAYSHRDLNNVVYEQRIVSDAEFNVK